jgi:uncharacterized protein
MNCRTKHAYNMPMPWFGPGNISCQVALAALCVLAATAHAQQASAPQPSSIRVTGDARVTAKPDRVQIDVGVVTRAAQAQEAAQQNARASEAMQGALRKAAGANAQIKTVSYALTPTYRYKANEEPQLTGYNATNTVQVSLDELNRVGAVIDAVTASGANQVQGIQFMLRDQDTVRAEALRLAALSARAKAEVLAGALQLKIVRVLNVEENSPRVMPLRTMLGGNARAASAAAATPVEAGTLDVTADVMLTVEVAPAQR